MFIHHLKTRYSHQRTAVYINEQMLQHTATHCNTLQDASIRDVRQPYRSERLLLNACTHVAVRCSMLQCVAVCCSDASLLMLNACTHANTHACVAVCCSVLQCVAACCSVLQYVAMYCSVLQCVVVSCSMLQCCAVCCSVL